MLNSYLVQISLEPLPIPANPRTINIILREHTGTIITDVRKPRFATILTPEVVPLMTHV
jgi:hypothetical protein